MLSDYTPKQKEALIIGGVVAAITGVATAVTQDGIVAMGGLTVLAAQQLAYAKHFPNPYKDDEDE